MSWWATIEGKELKTTIHDCPNCGGHEDEVEVERCSVNITYNVGNMLRRAGLHPKVLDGMSMDEALPIFENAFNLMTDNPDYFRRFNASNGWGTYETTAEAVSKLLNTIAHGSHPDDVLRWQ